MFYKYIKLQISPLLNLSIKCDYFSFELLPVQKEEVLSSEDKMRGRPAAAGHCGAATPCNTHSPQQELTKTHKFPLHADHTESV